METRRPPLELNASDYQGGKVGGRSGGRAGDFWRHQVQECCTLALQSELQRGKHEPIPLQFVWARCTASPHSRFRSRGSVIGT